MLRAGGAILEASPRYQAAVKAQQAREREQAAAKSLQAKALQLTVRAAMAQQNTEPKPARPSPASIIASVAKAHCMTAEEILSGTTKIDIVIARHDAMVRVKRAFPGMTPERIGELFNCHAKTVERALKQGKAFTGTRRRIDRAEVLRLVSLDMTPTQIAERMGFSINTVLQASFRVRNKKMSDEKMERLERAIKLRAKGMSFRTMANILGCSPHSLERDFRKAGM